jgi:hypothetical protein
LGVEDEKLMGIATKHWTIRWDKNKETFIYPRERKVLLEMCCPEECPDLTPQPLICYWGLLHPCGDLTKPLFTIPVVNVSTENENRGKKPESVMVFSMSAYLRMLLRNKQRTIDLELPELAERFKRLKSFFSDPPAPKGEATTILYHGSRNVP